MLGDGELLLDQELVYLASLYGLANETRGDYSGRLGVVGKLDASGLAPPCHKNLCLEDHGCAQLSGDGYSLAGTAGNTAPGCGQTAFPQDLLRFEFEELHSPP